MTPAVARPGGLSVFTITGSGFTTAAVVAVEPDGVIQSVAVASATTLVATVSFPAGARTGILDHA